MIIQCTELQYTLADSPEGKVYFAAHAVGGIDGLVGWGPMPHGVQQCQRVASTQVEKKLREKLRKGYHVVARWEVQLPDGTPLVHDELVASKPAQIVQAHGDFEEWGQ